MHPILRRYQVEELVRLRSADEQRRYASSQRSGRVDPNPHQIDAVMFALKRIRDGGCILADEVGLGKTIEAGLVIAQLMAEGAERILIITPKSLLGQWQLELFELFDIDAQEWHEDLDLGVPGVFLVSRDFAGGVKGSDILHGVPPFDLAVIDEAHEVFAGIYRRFDRRGRYQADSKKAQMAGRVRGLLLGTPVLLLTATPIQNSLTELWGLVQFVEPSGTLLGTLYTFREVFCAGDDRKLVEGQEEELRARLAQVCQRTLRRQAQEFMKQPFVGRRAQLFEYDMSPDEKSLYDDVTNYLLEPGICAFRGNYRQLLLLGFHRRMASSNPALAASLEKVAARLERTLDKATLEYDDPERVVRDMLEDLEDDGDIAPTDVDEGPVPPPEIVRAELERVRGYVHRCLGLSSDSKARALIRAVRLVLERGPTGEGSGKIVIFTESLTTQAYLRDLLLEQELVTDAEITLFRGENRGPRVDEALAHWEEEQLSRYTSGRRPSKHIAVRLALVHEFRTRSRVFISTEAGAKGLNLQFAGTLVNYDLPWNPQRIEQRIGRIHRYGQRRDVLVINFLARGNEAQRLTFEILSQKLDLFGTVLDASDVVLHEARSDASETLVGVLGADFESSLRRIYDRARTVEEIEVELRSLRENLEERRERFSEAHRRTSGLIESRFDDQVKRVFQRIQDELPGELAALDRDMEQVVTAYLDAIGVSYSRRSADGIGVLEVSASEALPEDLRPGLTVAVGGVLRDDDLDMLHLGHPLIPAALAEARQATQSPTPVQWDVSDNSALKEYKGCSGRLALVRLTHRGFETVEVLLPVAVLEGSQDPLDLDLARALLSMVPRDAEAVAPDVPDDDLQDAIELVVFDTHGAIAAREQERFQQAVKQLETWMEDQLLLLGRERLELLVKLSVAEAKRDGAIGADSRTKSEAAAAKISGDLDGVDAEIARLRARNDDDYVRWNAQANERRYRPPVVETLMEVEFVLR